MKKYLWSAFMSQALWVGAANILKSKATWPLSSWAFQTRKGANVNQCNYRELWKCVMSSPSSWRSGKTPWRRWYLNQSLKGKKSTRLRERTKENPDFRGKHGTLGVLRGQNWSSWSVKVRVRLVSNETREVSLASILQGPVCHGKNLVFILI